MDVKRIFVALVFALVGLVATTSTASAVTYTLVDLGPGPGGKDAYADAANAKAQAGYYLYEHLSCGKDCSFPVYHAMTWSGAGSQPIDITPPLQNFVEAWAYGAAGKVVVGTGITNNGGYFGYAHALLWHGAPLAWLDINPTGATVSNAYATDGKSIAGSAEAAALHAIVWQAANPASFIDLQPPSGYSQSEALGVRGTVQVGYAVPIAQTTAHAMLWSGTPSSAVDLTPANVSAAFADGVYGSEQVGYGVVSPGTKPHALLWHGSASKMKDLNPSGFVDSYARAVRLGVQAGYGHTASNVLHALVWTGSAASAVDLQSSMPSAYTSSQAFGFDANGDIIGAALYDSGGVVAWHGVMWVPGPLRPLR